MLRLGYGWRRAQGWIEWGWGGGVPPEPPPPPHDGVTMTKLGRPILANCADPRGWGTDAAEEERALGGGCCGDGAGAATAAGDWQSGSGRLLSVTNAVEGGSRGEGGGSEGGGGVT